MEIDFFRAFAICYIGNMLPIPFILLFIRKIFSLLKKVPSVEKMIVKLEARSIRKADKVEKYRLWGLLIFVAIPLPGTGAWTGALIADLFDIRIISFYSICVKSIFCHLTMIALEHPRRKNRQEVPGGFFLYISLFLIFRT